jgi:hypothetical protein
MPVVKDNDHINEELLKSLNIKIPVSKFYYSDAENIKSFGLKFFGDYGAIPDSDAYEGYDNFLFIGRCISKYGTNFQHLLSEDKSYYLQTAFDIQPFSNENSGNEIDYFENRHLDIIYYDGKSFIKQEP